MSELELSKYFISKKVPYVRPLYNVDLNKDSDIIDWFRETSFGLSEYFRPLFREQKSNLAFFIGAGVNPNWASPYTQIYANTSDIIGSDLQVFVNDMYRLAMDQVTLVTSHELVPDVLPNSDNYSDKVACNVVKDWLESMNYTLDMDSWRFKLEMQKKIFGEAFAIVLWNPNIGDIHPLAKKYVDEEIQVVDEEGKGITDAKKNPLMLRKNMRIGDIQIINPMPWDVIIDPKINSEESLWFYWVEYLEVDYLKKEFPNLDWDIKGMRGTDIQYDTYSNTERDNPNKRRIFYLFHKSHKFMPEGRYMICSDEHVLVNEPLTMETLVESQNFPMVQFRDLDMGIGNRGFSLFFRNGRNLCDVSNKLVNQMYSNSEMESPKMYVHENSGVDAQRMSDGSVMVEWHGNVKPSVETPTSNTQSLFNLQQLIQKSLDQVSLQNPLVKGETPNAQLDSFIALQYFEDIRTQLASPEIKSHIRCMAQFFRLMITVARDKYRKDDGRLMKILGKNNTYQLKYFDPINLQKSYDVHIRTTGNLANSKAARTQMTISIKREFPNIITDEVFIDMLGLSDSKKFMNAITASVSSAEAENQDMMNGNPVLSPARFEDLIVHWETHRIPMQTLDFKNSSQEVQDLFIGHVAATEKLMFEIASENPLFGQRLEQLKQFPMLYTPKPVNEVIPPQEGEMMEPQESIPPEEPNQELAQEQVVA